MAFIRAVDVNKTRKVNHALCQACSAKPARTIDWIECGGGYFNYHFLPAQN